jgi:hypothetical protein
MFHLYLRIQPNVRIIPEGAGGMPQPDAANVHFVEDQ